MKPQVLIGVVIALVVAGGATLAPRLLPSASRDRDAESATAYEAYAKLQQHSSLLGAAQRAGNIGELEKGDIDALATAATPALEKVVQRMNTLAQRRNKEAQAMGLTPTPIPGLSVNATRLRDSIRQIDAVQKKNAARWPAQSSGQSSAGVAALPHAAGLQAYVRAASTLGEAHEARLRMYRALSDARAALGQDATAGSEARYWAGLDYDTPKSELAKALEEIATRKSEAEAQVATLTQQVDERKTKIRELSQRTSSARGELETLQAQGFKLGDERAFADYAARMRTLQEQINEAQKQWVLYEQGGRANADFQGGDSALNAEIVGGEQIIPLAILEARLAAAQDAVRRTDIGLAALREETERLSASKGVSDSRSGTLGEMQSAAKARAKQSLETALAEAVAADKLESDAAGQAQKAVSSFGAVASTLKAIRSEAANLKSTYDPNGKNERLRKIAADSSPELLGLSAQAEAKLLLGQVEVSRAQALDALLATLRIANESGVKIEADTAAMETALTASRDAAKAALQEAATAYEGAVTNQLPTAAKGWASVARAGAMHWLSLADPAGAEGHIAASKQALEAASASLSKHPLYGRRLAAFGEFLNPPSASQPAASSPTSTPAGEESGAESKPSESGDDDLFGDDEG